MGATDTSARCHLVSALMPLLLGFIGGLAMGWGLTTNYVLHAFGAFASRMEERRSQKPAGPLTRYSARGITSMAALIAGPKRRPDLLEEWRTLLAATTSRRKVLMAHGFILGAFKMRLRDLADLAWIPTDRILGSRTLSNLFVLIPTVIFGLVIFRHAGTIGIMESMEDISVVAGGFYGLIRCGRWWRSVKPPAPRPRAKD
jgi:hypothetical protein